MKVYLSDFEDAEEIHWRNDVITGCDHKSRVPICHILKDKFEGDLKVI